MAEVLEQAPPRGLGEHLGRVVEVARRAMKEIQDLAARHQLFGTMREHLMTDLTAVEKVLKQVEQADAEEDLSPVDPLLFTGMSRYHEAITLLIDFMEKPDLQAIAEVESCCGEGDELLLEAEQELSRLAVPE